MNNKLFYLSGTSLLPDEKMDRPVVFLVESLIDKNVHIRLKDTGYEILPKIWCDRKRLNESSDYLDKVYERLSEKIGFLLSQIHGVDHPPSFWEIPMASWLLHYIQALYDRYARLKSAVEIYGKRNISLLTYQCDIIPPMSFGDVIEITSESEPYVSALYGAVAEKMGIPIANFTSEKDLKFLIPHQSKGIKLGKYFHLLINKIEDEVHNPMPLCFFKRKTILISSHLFNKREKIFLASELNALCIKQKKTNVRPHQVNRGVLSSIIGNDEFENIVLELLPNLMPTYL